MGTINIKGLRKFILLAFIGVTINVYGQDKLMSILDTLKLKEGESVRKEAYQYSYSGKYFTVFYNVVTDSIVHCFGLEFRSADSSFVRKIPMPGMSRKQYDEDIARNEYIKQNQEQMRKETVEFLNNREAAYEVWSQFKLLEMLDK